MYYVAGLMSESSLKMASDSIRNAVWEYTTTKKEILLLSRTFHTWAGLCHARSTHNSCNIISVPACNMYVLEKENIRMLYYFSKNLSSM